MMKMTSHALNVIHAVLDYKRFICSQNMLDQFHRDDFDWFAETEKYYYSLDLPEGMPKNRTALETILSYQTGSGQEKINRMDNTETENLHLFTL